MVWRNNLINAKFWVVIYLYLVNRCSLIKFDQLKMLTAENPILPLIALHISPTGWVPTISVLTLAVCVQRRMLEQGLRWVRWVRWIDKRFEHYTVILHSFVNQMCEFVILAHVWDAFGFLRKSGVTDLADSSSKTFVLLVPTCRPHCQVVLGSCACFVLTAWFSLTLLTTWGHHRHEVGDNATPMSCWCLSRCAV
jgi:hypothetical protein